MLTEDQSNAIFISNLYNAITKDIELKPGMTFNTEGSMNLSGGYKVVVHSNDHDTHFHVKHNEIDATFSFPDIQFIRHKSKKEYTSKQIRNIITTCSNNWMCAVFIESELAKRSA
jgi:galactose-1-phosphate uridylyltransferase